MVSRQTVRWPWTRPRVRHRPTAQSRLRRRVRVKPDASLSANALRRSGFAERRASCGQSTSSGSACLRHGRPLPVPSARKQGKSAGRCRTDRIPAPRPRRGRTKWRVQGLAWRPDDAPPGPRRCEIGQGRAHVRKSTAKPRKRAVSGQARIFVVVQNKVVRACPAAALRTVRQDREKARKFG